jgi:hypothetical protein
MSNLKQESTPNNTSETSFDEFSFVPAAPALNRTSTRRVYFVASILIGLVLVGTSVAYFSRSKSHVDPNAPQFVMEVSGMHCPLQCGLRMASALETLKWVIPDSVAANPKTGVVTFAATSASDVNPEEIRQVVEKAGFGFKSLNRQEVSEAK